MVRKNRAKAFPTPKSYRFFEIFLLRTPAAKPPFLKYFPLRRTENTSFGKIKQIDTWIFEHFYKFKSFLVNLTIYQPCFSSFLYKIITQNIRFVYIQIKHKCVILLIYFQNHPIYALFRRKKINDLLKIFVGSVKFNKSKGTFSVKFTKRSI